MTTSRASPDACRLARLRLADGLALAVRGVGLGLLAAVFGTLASVQSRKATTDQAKARAAVLWSALALLTVLLAIPWWRPLLRLFNL